MTRSLFAIAVIVVNPAAAAQTPAGRTPVQISVDELRHVIGRWEAVTSFLTPDGSAASTVTGTYEFSWIVPDRVVAGRSAIPERQQASGILFYVNEARGLIEMVSVGADGRLWVMTGPLGGDYRMTPDFASTGGGTNRLRFTRFNVTADTFESRMEYSEDRGATWQPGNHQRFRRVGGG